MKKLCILTYGRTGSSALIGAGQENFKHTKSPAQAHRRIFAVSEIFDAEYVAKSHDCCAADGFMLPYVHRLEQKPDIAQHLAQFLTIAEEQDAAVFVCKLVIGNNEILHALGDYINAMADFKFVFLTRNVIDVCISMKKAIAVQAWSHTDTTAIKVDLDLDALYLLDNWCNDCLSACSKLCEPLILDYKELFHGDVCAVAAYNRMLNTCFGDTVLYLTHNDVVDIQPKQDKNTTFRQSIRAIT